MAAPARRSPVRKVLLKRRPLSPSSLRMMVQSGVVRWAVCNPPPAIQARVQMMDEMTHGSKTETRIEQGWLSQIVLGRRPQPVVSKRLRTR